MMYRKDFLIIYFLSVIGLIAFAQNNEISPVKFVPNENAISVPDEFKNTGQPGIEIWDYGFKEPLWIPYKISINDLIKLYGKKPDGQYYYDSAKGINGDAIYQFTLEDGFVLFTIRNDSVLAMIYPQKTQRYSLANFPKSPVSEGYIISVLGERISTQGEATDTCRYDYYADKRYRGLRFDMQKDINAAIGFRVFGPAY